MRLCIVNQPYASGRCKDKNKSKVTSGQGQGNKNKLEEIKSLRTMEQARCCPRDYSLRMPDYIPPTKRDVHAISAQRLLFWRMNRGGARAINNIAFVSQSRCSAEANPS